MKHECQISVNLFGMSYLEGQVTKSIGANAAKGRLALEHVINAIETEVRGFSDNITVSQSLYHTCMSVDIMYIYRPIHVTQSLCLAHTHSYPGLAATKHGILRARSQQEDNRWEAMMCVVVNAL